MRPCGWCRFFFWVAFEEERFVWINMIFFSCLLCGLVNLVKMWWFRTDAPKCVKVGIPAQKRGGNEGEERKFGLYFFGAQKNHRVNFIKIEGVSGDLLGVAGGRRTSGCKISMSTLFRKRCISKYCLEGKSVRSK